MKLIPIYHWQGNRVFASSKKISNYPWFKGMLLLLCVVIAMLLANLPWTHQLYHDLLHTQLTIHVQSPGDTVNVMFPRDMTVEKFINDILMVIFFFTVGLEIKREIAYGELSSRKKAMLPVIAAFGGVVMPALIFTLVNHGQPGASGWGIPTATDIAFAICILTALGDRVPTSLKVFLTALAIVDDLIAILVVALFYGGTINLWLVIAAIVMTFIGVMMRKLNIKSMFPYIVVAIIIWILFYYGGIHATMSGVVMAFVIPSKPLFDREETMRRLHEAEEGFHYYDGLVDDIGFPSGPQRHYLRAMRKAVNGSMNMSYILERALNPWVNYLIMPLFALANAGVYLGGGAGLGAVAAGIMLGLIIGKPLGITLFSWIAIKLGIGEKPEGASWLMFLAVACLGGIGFTMSIFVDTLSFSDQVPAVTEALRSEGKIAVLLGSVCAAIIGTIFISIVGKIKKK